MSEICFIRAVMQKLIFLFLLMLANQAMAKIAEAIFAGGNFWRLEADFNNIKGVLDTVSGFDGGTSKNPSYEEVANGHSDYTEAVRVIYNTSQVSYKEILDYYWHHIDPGAINSQFCDYGPQYRSVIFYLNKEQQGTALDSKRELEKNFKNIYTQILPSTQFYAAEGYHQNFYQKHPLRYKYYLYRCGHEQRIRELWKNEH